MRPKIGHHCRSYAPTSAPPSRLRRSVTHRAYGARLSRRGLERRSLTLRDHLYGTRMFRARFYTDPLKTVTVHIIIFCFVSLSYYFTRSIAVLMTK